MTKRLLKKGIAFALAVITTISMAPATTFAEVTDTSRYVLMNIPYDEFYEAELDNSKAVDAVSSATKTNTRTWSHSAGSYHKDSTGSTIDGVVYAVEVPAGTDLSAYKEVTDASTLNIEFTDATGETTSHTLEGRQVLFESETYSYYELKEAPACYKKLVVEEDGSFTFGKAIGEVTEGILDDTDIEFSTESRYGDYQLNLNIDPTNLGYADKGDLAEVNAVVISTTEGNSYGLRTMENIWNVGNLAWCSGKTTSVNGCETKSDHYVHMMMQTIESVTYYTPNGIYHFEMFPTYVPLKGSDDMINVTAKDGAVTTGMTTMKLTVPDDFTPVCSVEGLLGVSFSNNALIKYDKDAVAGKYTLVVSDSNEIYAPISTSFILTTSVDPAQFSSEYNRLVPAEGVDTAHFEGFLKNITTVKVNGNNYDASGDNKVTIINEDGSLNVDAAPFTGSSSSYDITVVANGYPDFSFTYGVAGQEDKELAEAKYMLRTAIEDAEKISNDDSVYTAESFAALTNAITEAKAVLASQSATIAQVNEAKDKIQTAKAALKTQADADEEAAMIEQTEILQTAVEEAKAIGNADGTYTSITYRVFSNALLNAENVLASGTATSTELKAAYDRLKQAKEGLKTTEQEKEEAAIIVATKTLNETIADAETINNDDLTYTAESFKALTDAIATAKTVLASGTASSVELFGCNDAILAAKGSLKTQEEADEEAAIEAEKKAVAEARAELTDLIAEAEVLGHQEDIYTSDTCYALRITVARARTVLNNEKATSAELNGAIALVKEAKTALKPIAEAEEEEAVIQETEQLNNVVADAKTISNTDGTYTKESYKALTDAIAAAEALLASGKATSAELKAANEAVVAAKAALKSQAEEDAEKEAAAKEAATEEVKTTITEAKKVSNDKGTYTAASYKKLTDTIAAAEALIKSGTATAAQISEANAKILAAQKALVKIVTQITVSGVTYKIIGSSVVVSKTSKNIKKVVIPATVKINGKSYRVTIIQPNVFKGCKKLTTVTIGKNVIAIGKNAFNGCKKLSKVTFSGNKLLSIGSKAFKGTKKLTVKAPKKVLKKYKKLVKKAGAKVK